GLFMTEPSQPKLSRRKVAGLIAAAPLSGLFARSALAQDVVTIGAIFPLTGANSVFGNQNYQGVDIAVDLINEAGGVNGRKISLFKGDGQSP
ncbi:ABC transporter substrate-binding protein, partial [Acinetobacter baumannii]